jgi:hypothetical protein
VALDATAADFRATGLRLKAGDAALMPIVRRNIRAATAPAKVMVPASARATLPHGGGLNEWVAAADVKTSILLGPKTAGVRIRVSKKGHDMKDIDVGNVRSPTFGRRKGKGSWHDTKVTPGFATKPLLELYPVTSVACRAAMLEVARIAGFH